VTVARSSSQSAPGDSNTARGRQAEAYAARYLECEEGYEIVERNHRNPRGEIDLIAWDRSGSPEEEAVLCFIEIKSRSHSYHGSAAEAVDRRKQTRVRRAAEVYLLDLDEIPDCRFDVVTLELGPDGEWSLELFRNAFS
jgi:putative endonuclease